MIFILKYWKDNHKPHKSAYMQGDGKVRRWEPPVGVHVYIAVIAEPCEYIAFSKNELILSDI